jgi:hypothetical protein
MISAEAVNPSMSMADAGKVDSLCARIIGDLGSVHMRVTPPDTPMPTELVALRQYVRAVQDAVRDRYPEAFFR